jgi:hypothetical protein
VRRGRIFFLAALGLAAGASRAAAEPIFLSRQYTRCTNCHYSPTGGGLLTPYGRSLSREELSTFGASHGAASPSREQDFLFGALGKGLGPVSVGLDLLPAHLSVDAAGYSSSRDFLMNAALAAGLQYRKWTFYGQVGRQPRGEETRVTSFEHWILYQADKGVGVRVGRFLPAYGVRLADHTAFTRATLGFDNNDQIYGLELSYKSDRHLVQVAAGPGRAESLVNDDGQGAFTATGRWQFDLRPRTVLVASGAFRDASDLVPRGGSTGLALGFAPTSRLTLWTEADVRFREGSQGEPSYSLFGQAAYEVVRGVWLELSPQLLTQFGDASAGVVRFNVGLNLLPRTHWNVVVSFYNDHDRVTGNSARTFLAQLHFY